MFLSFARAEIYLNEIMYNPEGSDNNREFIELYLTESENIENYTIEDSSTSAPDHLTLLQYRESSFALIVEEDFDYSSINASIYSVGAAIGNGLNNDRDTLILKDRDGNIIEAITYTNNWGGNNNGNTLCKIPEITGLWQECSSTPGLENQYTLELQNFSYLSINEFLADPIGEDDADKPAGEWVELYNAADFPIDIQNLALYDENDDNELYITSTTTQGSTIIPERGYLVIYRNGDSDFNLNDNDDTIRLYTGYPVETRILLDQVSYHNTEENVSWSKISDEWVQSILTPGYENIPLIPRYQDYSSIEITEVMPDPQGNDDAPAPEGEWIELFNNGNTVIDLRNMFLEDEANHELTITTTNAMSGTQISPQTYKVVYVIELSGFLNNDYEEIRLYDPNNNLIDTISYSSTEESLSWSKVNELWRQTLPTPNAENYEEAAPNTVLNIEAIYLGRNNKAKFGETIRVRLKVLRGNTTRESISLYAEDSSNRDISKKTTFNIPERFTNNTITLPIQLIPNCNENFKDGTYFIVLSGLQEEDKEEFEIEGITETLCPERDEQIKTNSLPVNIIEIPHEILMNEEIKIRVNLQNDAVTEQKWELWSYIYKGPKSISGERTENLQEVTVPPNSSIDTTLTNTIEEGTREGEYKIKVKFKEKDKKTAKEITQNIKVMAGESPIKEQTVQENTKTKNILFSSPEQKARSIGIYMLSLLLIIIIIQLVRKKDI